jgi:hypothetical protein
MTEVDSTLDPFVEAEIKETSRTNRARNSRDWNRYLSLVDMGRTTSVIPRNTTTALRSRGLNRRAASWTAFAALLERRAP